MTHIYVTPFVLYVLGTAAAAQSERFGPAGYAVTAVAAALVSWRLLRGTAILRPHGRLLAAGLVGIVGIVAWIGLSELHLEDALWVYLPEWLRPGGRVGLNPFEAFATPAVAWAYVAIRLFGLTVAVPVAEELFWRGFLLRWVDGDDWERVPPGQFSGRSFLIVTVLFTLAHPEWFAAALYCVLLNGLMYWKRDLWVCVVAHAISNLLLGLYILVSGQWWLW